MRKPIPHADPVFGGMRSDSVASPREVLRRKFSEVRRRSEAICRPLQADDYVIQSMPDVSPPKWHLAHTTWFFETFLLIPHLPSYEPFHPQFQYLFNSYYKSLGKHHPRGDRGLLSRPTVEEVYEYRRAVDEAMERLISESPREKEKDFHFAVRLGCHHEEQHQELLLMDILHVFFSNPLRPVYQKLKKFSPLPRGEKERNPLLHWFEYPEGVVKIGHEGSDFSFDNETPRHRVFLENYRLASRLVTNGEYLQFMEEGGYRDARHWLSNGWDAVQQNRWEAPFYWEKRDGQWWRMSLSGMRPVVHEEPVSHVSFFEADAYARWAGKRLPTEAEWENAVFPLKIEGNFYESGFLSPQALARPREGYPSQMFGDVWEWTASPYVAYPRFKPLQGSFGEYNGKFMCDQWVLRGGCCFTPESHFRKTYRNFFPSHTRWQCSGIRLAEDL